MREVEQKIIDMTLAEFKTWDVPEGWKMVNVSGNEHARYEESGLSWDFFMHVTIRKEA